MLVTSALFFACFYINRAENLHQTSNFMGAITLWNIVVAVEQML